MELKHILFFIVVLAEIGLVLPMLTSSQLPAFMNNNNLVYLTFFGGNLLLILAMLLS